MLSTARSRAALLSRRVALSGRRAYAFSANDNKEINTAGTPKEVPNVSKTNELPIENPFGDHALQESVEKGESLRVKQAPNRAEVWSRSQNPRAKAMSGPRFEQTLMEFQVCRFTQFRYCQTFPDDSLANLGSSVESTTRTPSSYNVI